MSFLRSRAVAVLVSVFETRSAHPVYWRSSQLGWIAVLITGLWISSTLAVGAQTPTDRAVIAVGRVVSLQAGSIRAAEQGPVRSIKVEVGDQIAAGKTLVELDPIDAQIAQRRAARAVTLAQAQQAVLAQRVALAQQVLSRLTSLRRSAAFNESQLEDQQLEVARLQAELNAARATVELRRSDLESAAVMRSRMTVTAPFGGLVTATFVEAGDYANRGQELLRITSTDRLEIEVDVAITQALKGGDRVDILPPSGQWQAATGEVRTVIPVMDTVSRTRQARVAFAETPPWLDALSIGQTIEVKIGG